MSDSVNQTKATVLDDKLIKLEESKDGLVMRITKNKASERFFVEFSSKDGKLVVQRSYQDSISGRIQSEEFMKNFNSINDLKNYFKLKQRDL